MGSGPLALPGEHDIIKRHMLQLDADPPGSGQADELPVGAKALVAEQRTRAAAREVRHPHAGA